MSESEPMRTSEPSVRSMIVDPHEPAPSSSRAQTGDNTDTSTLMCRRYMIGKCKKARKCPYSHSMDHLPTTFCRDYIYKYCKYGSRCKKRHLNPKEENRREVLRKKYIKKKQMTWHDANVFEPALPNYMERQPLPPNVSTLEELKEEPLCQHAIEGTCTNDPCIFLHGFQCNHCKKPVIHPFDRIQGRTHVELCSRTAGMLKNYLDLIKESENEECGICYEKVLSAEKKEEDRKFGLLPGCMHKFCLCCIRRWRSCSEGAVSQENRRSCPNCRQKSYFVVPSQVWISELPHKKIYIEEYKKDLKRKPCKYYRHSGECPFSNNCFYSHEQIDGQGEVFTPRESDRGLDLDQLILADAADAVEDTIGQRILQVRETLNAIRVQNRLTEAGDSLSNLMHEIDQLHNSLRSMGITNNPSTNNNSTSNNRQ